MSANSSRPARPYRCKDGRNRSVLVAVRLAPADKALLLRIGRGSATAGVETLLEMAKENLR